MIAYLFPGQGSHEIGMGKNAADASSAAAALFHQADEILGFSLSTLCFEGPLDELTDTVNQQPALFVSSIATLTAMREAGVDQYPEPHFVAGHSLGELSALAAAGAISFEDGLKLVRRRGELMKEAGTLRPGGMAAFLGVSREDAESACATAAQETSRVVQVANDNCPGQIVISGENEAVDRAMQVASEAGAKKVVKLPITIAAHSPLMGSASEAFAAEVAATHIQAPSVPVIGNTTAAPLTTVEEIQGELNAQLTDAVRWTESMQFLVEQGISAVYEVGPKDVLNSMMKRINRKVARNQFS